jgi:hypothetical protein
MTTTTKSIIEMLDTLKEILDKDSYDIIRRNVWMIEMIEESNIKHAYLTGYRDCINKLEADATSYFRTFKGVNSPD